MSRFETAPRLAAWAGVAPGNDESAGKQRSGKTRKGNRPLRAILTQLAHAAVRTKGTYLSALYQRLAARRGKNRAIVAVAHAIMRSVFYMLSRQEPYHELGANYFDERRRHYTVDRLARRIEHLGYRVHLEPVASVAREIFKATVAICVPLRKDLAQNGLSGASGSLRPCVAPRTGAAALGARAPVVPGGLHGVAPRVSPCRCVRAGGTQGERRATASEPASMERVRYCAPARGLVCELACRSCRAATATRRGDGGERARHG